MAAQFKPAPYRAHQDAAALKRPARLLSLQLKKRFQVEGCCECGAPADTGGILENQVASPSIAIILPAYNEEQTIAGTVEAFHRAAPDAHIYVINNNSRDATRQVALRCLEEHGIPGRVIDEYRQGKGNAVRRAFLDINADIYVMADADLTYPAERIHDLIAPY